MHLRKLDYKWVALSNTTLGTLLAMINSSILLIALPNIFRGIGIDPLQPGNTGYLLWLLLGFLVVLAVLLVSLGRLGDMYGRVRMFRLGFAVFTFFSILLSVTWLHGGAGALWLIGMRVGQGVGAAMVFANSSAILTDAFPHRSSGGSSSSSRCRSASSRPSGRTARCGSSACAGRGGSTGGGTSRSRPASSC